MKQNIIIFLVFIYSIVQAQGINDSEDRVDFFGTGSSPEWKLSVKMNDEIKFIIKNTEFVFNSSAIKEIYPKGKLPLVINIGGALKHEPDGWIFSAKNKKSKIKITAVKNSESKNGNDSAYYSVKIVIKDIRKKKTKTYSGYGNYTSDKRLENIWFTKKILGGDFEHSKYTKDSSSIFFSINGHTASGIAGCNYYSFKIEVRGQIISFYGATMTMVMCDNHKEETKFFGALGGKDLRYRFEDNKLYLEDGDKTIIEFEKRNK